MATSSTTTDKRLKDFEDFEDWKSSKSRAFDLNKSFVNDIGGMMNVKEGMQAMLEKSAESNSDYHIQMIKTLLPHIRFP
jgi:imidazoleglycerol phosphate synthase glutamine amidotransferase subunit HisH